MTVADFALAVSAITLFLVILGVMREVVILRGEVRALSNLIVSPPTPYYFGERLPRALSEALPSLRDGVYADEPHVIAFVSPGCGPCTDLTTEIRDRVLTRELDPTKISFVVCNASESAEFFKEVASVGSETVADELGRMMTTWEIRATPSLLALSAGDRRVVDFVAGGDVEWIKEKLTAEGRAVEQLGTALAPI